MAQRYSSMLQKGNAFLCKVIKNSKEYAKKHRDKSDERHCQCGVQRPNKQPQIKMKEEVLKILKDDDDHHLDDDDDDNDDAKSKVMLQTG